MSANEILKRLLEVYSRTSVIFLKANKGCSVSGETDARALVVSCSVSSWGRKSDLFSQLELCLPATVNEFAFVPCDSAWRVLT